MAHQPKCSLNSSTPRTPPPICSPTPASATTSLLSNRTNLWLPNPHCIQFKRLPISHETLHSHPPPTCLTLSSALVLPAASIQPMPVSDQVHTVWSDTITVHIQKNNFTIKTDAMTPFYSYYTSQFICILWWQNNCIKCAFKISKAILLEPQEKKTYYTLSNLS